MKTILFAMLFFLLWTGPIQAVFAERLSNFLPDETSWKPDGSATLAENENELFAVIDGGAERYIKNGFRRALYQRFRDENGRGISIEIVETADGTAAKNLFTEMSGDGETRLDIGDAASLHGYYLLFRRGPFYVSLTGTGLGKNAETILAETARSMVARMARAGR